MHTHYNPHNNNNPEITKPQPNLIQSATVLGKRPQ